MDCSPPGSSVHGISQTRILEWVVIPFSRASSWRRGRTWVFCITGRFLTLWATREAPCGQQHAAAAAAKLLQTCPTLCDPRDGSPPGSSVHGILQARTMEWVAISSSNAWKWKVKMKSLSRVRLLATPWTAAYQAPPSMGFSRQEYWSGVPLPSPAFHWTEVFNYDVIKVIIIFVLCCVLVKFYLQCLFLPCDYENIFLCFLLFTLLFYVSHLHLYRICSLALK